MEVRLGQASQGPLAGYRVIDLSTVVSGPLCGQILADLGADVVKIEAPGGESGRMMGFPQKQGISPLFAQCNRNKRSVVLDLKLEQGQSVARRLLETADVLVANFRPGVAERLGLGYEALCAVNPGLVYVAISGFGPDGPYRDLPAYDTVIQGLSGFMKVQSPNGTPELVQSIIADKAAALTASNAVMAALLGRERSPDKLGQRVDVPMIDAFAAFLLPDLLAGRTFPNDEAPAIPNIHRTWETADGHVVMMIIEDRQFFALCEILERPDLIEDPRCADFVTRLVNMQEIFSTLEDELKKHTTEHIVARARQLGAPVAPVNDIDDFLADPQVAHNGTVFEVDTDPELGHLRMIRSPFRLERNAPSVTRLPPRLGEHTDEVLGEAGFEPAELLALRESGAIA
jgi:crotonobetainyl-CoA:carnitine CoA-transferase CaiB-like acyl-CoA transferase